MQAAEVFGEVRSLMGDAPDVDTFVEATGPESLKATIQSMAKPGVRIVAMA
ncbi:hypothetical protein ACWGKQ_14525 [Streptomyces sp. NPDC054770]